MLLAVPIATIKAFLLALPQQADGRSCIQGLVVSSVHCHHPWVSHSTSHFPSYPCIPICQCYMGLWFGHGTRFLGRLHTCLNFVGTVLPFICFRYFLTFFHQSLLLVRGTLWSVKCFLTIILFFFLIKNILLTTSFSAFIATTILDF